ncbi:glycosyltransferase, partial [Streptomyces oryzae]
RADGPGGCAGGACGNADGARERDGAYPAHYRALAARLFPVREPGEECPVTFDEVGSPAVPTLADAYALGGVVVLSSVVEGFPVPLVEAMFCGRATVSTDVGAALEVVGGTGLLVPPRDPRALADACTALLRDPARAARLGAAARARALELFTVRQNIEAFRGIYLELMSHHPVGREESAAESAAGRDGARPFARPAESCLPGRWAEGRRTSSRPARRPSGPRAPGGGSGHVPSWARTERGERAEWAAVGADSGEATAP